MRNCWSYGSAIALLFTFATLPIAIAQQAPPATRPAVQGDTIRLEFIEANATGENPVWKLENYGFRKQQGKALFMSLFGTGTKVGTASTVFRGGEGYHTLTVEYFDDNSGRAVFELRVDGKAVSKWAADKLFGDVPLRHEARHIYLKSGSIIEIQGARAGYDAAGLLALEIAPGSALPPPPVVTVAPKPYSDNLTLLSERVPCMPPELMIPRPSRTWADVKPPSEFWMVPGYIFKAKKGERFEAEVANPEGTATRDYPWCVRPWPAQDKPTPAGTIAVAALAVERVQFDVPTDGIYELRIAGAVTGLSHPLTRRLTPDAREGHFYVPAGATGVRLKGSVEKGKPSLTQVTLRDPKGAIVWRGEVARHGAQDVAIPSEMAGQPWSFKSEGGRGITIEGAPAFCALIPADLLVPAEVLPATPVAAKPFSMPLAVQRPLAATATMPNAPAVTLTRDGRPMCVIVTPSSPAGIEASRHLQRAIQRISGATIPISDKLPQVGTAIVLGTPEEFPQSPLPKGFNELNGDGLVILTQPDRLYLIGRTHAAMTPAVFTFLRQLGCRWYFGDSEWEVLPVVRDIVVSQNLMTQADFPKRAIHAGSNIGAGVPDMRLWCQQNRLGGAISGGINHSYSQFVPTTLFETNPEYFAMKDTDGDGTGDRRTDGQPCTTHPDVIERFKAGGIKAFEADPELDMLSVSPNDGTVNMCRCDRCRAVGTYSDCAWTIAHQVADAVRAKFHGRKIWIGFYAYGVVSIPPTLKVPADPDLAIQVATAYNKVSVDTMFAEWPKYVGTVGVREYFAIPQWGGNRPGTGISPAKARRVIPNYKARKATMLNAEAYPAWGGTGLGMYVAAQLMWDSSQNVDAMLNEFYTDCFGAAAAAPMKEYFERWNREGFEPRTAKLALGNLHDALQKADTIESRRRVALYALYIHRFFLVQQWALIKDTATQPEKTAYAEMGGSFYWRNSENGLVARQSSAANSSYNAVPYFTYEEVLEIVREDLRLLKDVEVGELVTQYGSTLQPLPPEVVGPQQGSSDGWSSLDKQTWMVRAEQGKPISLELEGKGGHIKVRFLPPKGPALDEKDQPITDEKSTLQFMPPESGVYRLVIEISKGRYRIAKPNLASAVISKEKNRPWHKVSIPRDVSEVFFFVPPGAEAIVFGFRGKSLNGVAELCDGKGQVVTDVKPPEKSNLLDLQPRIIQVPPGADNQVWSLRMTPKMADSTLYLRGVPPYIQVDPQRLMVPMVEAEEEE